MGKKNINILDLGDDMLAQGALFENEFIKVFKCYTGTIDAFKNRCTSGETELFDDKFFNQMQACKNFHSNWISKHQWNQGEEIIAKYYIISSLMSKMVNEYLESTLKSLNLNYYGTEDIIA